MTHQIPPHLVFCTPGQNQEAEQGTNPKTSKRVTQQNGTEKETNKQKDRSTCPQ